MIFGGDLCLQMILALKTISRIERCEFLISKAAFFYIDYISDYSFLFCQFAVKSLQAKYVFPKNLRVALFFVVVCIIIITIVGVQYCEHSNHEASGNRHNISGLF